MADFKFTILANANPSDFKVLMYEITSPNAVVDETVINAPHTVSQQIVFTGLNKVGHYCRIYEWDGSTLGLQLGNFIVYPVEESIEQEKLLELTVGIDIDANQSDYDGSTAHPEYNNYVAGVDYWIERRGTGSLRDDEFQDNAPFGFSLLNGNTFNEEETFLLHFYARLSIQPANAAPSSSGGKWADIIPITGNITLGNNNKNCIHDIYCSTEDAPIITLDALANVPDMTPYKFINQRGTQYNAIIATPSGVQFIFINDVGATARTQVILGKGESVEIVKKGSFYYVIDFDGDYRSVGLVVQGYVGCLNTLPAHGQEISRTKYPRITAIVLENLTTGNGVVSDLDWLANTALQTNFSLGDGSTTIRLPNLKDLFLRNLKDGRNLGSFEDHEFEEHGHSIKSTNSGGSSGTGVDVVRGSTTGTVPTRGEADNTGSGNKTIGSAGGEETRPKNVGLTGLIRI